MIVVFASGTGLGVARAEPDFISACVPAGVPYIEVQPGDIPSDWSTSAAWEADFSNPAGIGTGDYIS